MADEVMCMHVGDVPARLGSGWYYTDGSDGNMVLYLSYAVVVGEWRPFEVVPSDLVATLLCLGQLRRSRDLNSLQSCSYLLLRQKVPFSI